MPRYFFHTGETIIDRDEVGNSLASLAAARIEALQLAGALLKERSDPLCAGSAWHVTVTDESGTIVHTVAVNVTDEGSPAGEHRPTQTAYPKLKLV